MKKQPQRAARRAATPKKSLAVISSPGLSHSIVPADAKPDEVAAIVADLERTGTHAAAINGICFTLQGLILIEMKKRLPHGQYLPWAKKAAGLHRKTAASRVAVAKSFLKCLQPETFEQLTLKLMDKPLNAGLATLDMTHPIVSALDKWTGGRVFAQLREEETEGYRPGGKTYARIDGKGARKTLSAEDAKEMARTVCIDAAERIATVHKEKFFMMLNAAEMDGLVDHCEAVAEDVRAWRKMSKADRAEAYAAHVRRLLGME